MSETSADKNSDVASADVQTVPLIQTTSNKKANPRDLTLIAFSLEHSRKISTIACVTLATITAFLMYQDRMHKEQDLRSHMDRAGLAEIDGFLKAASDHWHEAINVAKSMPDKQRLIADLYSNSGHCNKELWQNSLLDKPVKADVRQTWEWRRKNNAKINFFEQRALDDFESCLAILSKISNTNSDQLEAISQEIEMQNKRVMGTRWPDESNAYFVYSSDISTEENQILNEALADMTRKNEGLGITKFRQYLSETQNSWRIVAEVEKFATQIPESDVKTHRQLIPIICELIYFCHSDAETLARLFELLDQASQTIVAKPLTTESQAIIGDDALSHHDFHTAIVTYRRALGFAGLANPVEPTAQTAKLAKRLRQALLEERKERFKNLDPVIEYISLLRKKRKIEADAYGMDHFLVLKDDVDLLKAYVIACDFKKCHGYVKESGNEMRLSDSAEASMVLGDAYAKEGKMLWRAAQKYQEAKTREPKLAKRAFAKLAELSVCTGDALNASRYEKLSNNEDQSGLRVGGFIPNPLMPSE